jgi:putative oxidoreductase
MKLIRLSLDPDADSRVAAGGVLFLRLAVGALIFYVHGWHKLEGGLAYVRDGTPWKLAGEVAGMRFPWPAASAFAATAVQFVCAPLLAIGLFTRISATILTSVLSVAVAQNLLAARDPQLAVLYTVVVTAFIFIGGGRFSVDARLAAQTHR